jgi:hypothetical protein
VIKFSPLQVVGGREEKGEKGEKGKWKRGSKFSNSF